MEVRGSTWAVANVQVQGLPRSPADEATAQLSHVIDLQSLDEDRLGEQLSVVWELEVGHTVTPAQGLPDVIYADAFDDPASLAGFIDAMRWGAVASADPNRYQAPFWSGVNVEAYQLEPLRRALGAPRANLLLADDVGLGKTIEAGLVIQGILTASPRAPPIIVCPPSLALKWQDDAGEVRSGVHHRQLRTDGPVRRTHGLHANPFQLFPRVIVSMAWLPQVRAQRLLRDVYSQAADPKTGKRHAFDVLVVDEAHHVAPSSPSAIAGGRGYAVDTQRTVAVRQLAEKCEHRLFLSATPHNGHPESFTALMEMIDPRRFARGANLDSTALKDVTVRRLKTDLSGKGFKPPGQHSRCHAVRLRAADVCVARRHRHEERQAERHQARRRYRHDAVEEALPVQPVRLRHDIEPLLGLEGGSEASQRTSTTTSSARASLTKKRACGSRTRLRSCASPKAPTPSSPPSPANSKHSWSGAWAMRAVRTHDLIASSTS